MVEQAEAAGCTSQEYTERVATEWIAAAEEVPRGATRGHAVGGARPRRSRADLSRGSTVPRTVARARVERHASSASTAPRPRTART